MPVNFCRSATWPTVRISQTAVRWERRVHRTVTTSPGLGDTACALVRATWTTGRKDAPSVVLGSPLFALCAALRERNGVRFAHQSPTRGSTPCPALRATDARTCCVHAHESQHRCAYDPVHRVCPLPQCVLPLGRKPVAWAHQLPRKLRHGRPTTPPNRGYVEVANSGPQAARRVASRDVARAGLRLLSRKDTGLAGP